MTADRQPKPLVLVTGATGALGPCIVDVLHEAGYHIRTLTRDAPQPGLLPNAVDVRTGDISDLEAVRAVMSDCDAVIHMAALLHIANPSPRMSMEYQRINVSGTENILLTARQAGVKRVVFFSTITVYGCQNGQLLTETAPPQPETCYGRTKLEAEGIVLRTRRADGLPLGVVLRLGAVYGSRIKGNYRRLLQAMARGHFISIGSERNRRALIYDKDLAQATQLALIHPQAGGCIYNMTDGQIHSLQEIIEAMYSALGKRPSRWRVPKTPAHVGAAVVDEIGRRLLRHPLNLRASIDKYTEDTAIDGHRIQQELGFVPQYDLAAGWKEAVDEMRRAGEFR